MRILSRCRGFRQLTDEGEGLATGGEQGTHVGVVDRVRYVPGLNSPCANDQRVRRWWRRRCGRRFG
jgi:hypothetical protein